MIEKLRATAEVRPAAEPAVGLVPDANGGDPILYGDEEQRGAPERWPDSTTAR
jgi:hypothetical protein